MYPSPFLLTTASSISLTVAWGQGLHVAKKKDSCFPLATWRVRPFCLTHFPGLRDNKKTSVCGILLDMVKLRNSHRKTTRPVSVKLPCFVGSFSFPVSPLQDFIQPFIFSHDFLSRRSNQKKTIRRLHYRVHGKSVRKRASVLAFAELLLFFIPESSVSICGVCVFQLEYLTCFKGGSLRNNY